MLMPLQIQTSLTLSGSSLESLLRFSSRLPSPMPSILAGWDETSTTSSLLPRITTSSSSTSTLNAVPLRVCFFPFFEVRHSLDESLSVDSSLPLADFGCLPPLSFGFVPHPWAFFVCKASFDAAAFCVCRHSLPDFWSIVRVVMIGSFTMCSTCPPLHNTYVVRHNQLNLKTCCDQLQVLSTWGQDQLSPVLVQLQWNQRNQKTSVKGEKQLVWDHVRC